MAVVEAVGAVVTAEAVAAEAVEAARDVEAVVVLQPLLLEGPPAPLEGALGSPPCL